MALVRIDNDRGKLKLLKKLNKMFTTRMLTRFVQYFKNCRILYHFKSIFSFFLFSNISIIVRFLSVQVDEMDVVIFFLERKSKSFNIY